MLEQVGNIWTDHGTVAAHMVVVPVNGVVKASGELVMGKGIAGQAKFRFPGIAQAWGAAVQQHGSIVMWDHIRRLVSFPTKYHWTEASSIGLIERGVQNLARWNRPEIFYLPRLGCGEGRLKWAQVKPLLAQLPDNYIVVHDGRSQD